MIDVDAPVQPGPTSNLRVYIGGKLQPGYPTQALGSLARMENGKALAFWDPEQQSWIAYEFPDAPQRAAMIDAEPIIVNVWLTREYDQPDWN